MRTKILQFFFASFFTLGLITQQVYAQTTINLAAQCNCEVLSGTGTPTPGTPAANAGNLYIDDSTGDVYSFDGTAWTPVAKDVVHNWYGVGTTESATSINDEVYTLGKVGIGVPAPDYVLDIFESVKTGATVRIKSSGNLTGNPFDYEGGPAILFETQASVSNDRTSQGIFLNRIDSNSEWFFGNPSGYLNQVNADGFGIARMVTAGTHNNDVAQGSNLLMYINNTGNVGIGTVTPAQKLHVDGNIRSDGRNYYFGANQRLFGDNNSALYFNSANVNTTQMIFRDADNEVYGRLQGSGDGTNFGLMDKNAQWVFLSQEASNLSFRISNSEKFRVNAAGNMGIGTTGPTERLDVAGKLRVRTFDPGAATDQVLVVGNNGVVKKAAASGLGLLSTAGNDIDIAGTQINVEPILDFVHTMNSPAQQATFSAGGNVYMRAWFDGHVGIGTLTPAAGLHVSHDDGIIADGTFGAGQHLAAGAGTRLIWSPKTASFRAGLITGTQWDEANTGNYSVGLGFNALATGGFSFAGGSAATASNDYSFAYGVNTVSSGISSIAFGNLADAGGNNSFAAGNKANASANHSVAMGFESAASGLGSVALGSESVASGSNSGAWGFQTVASGTGSFAIGWQAEATGIGSKTLGAQTVSSGHNGVAIGEGTLARSRAEVAVGMFNGDYTPASASAWSANDRVFSVGIGQSASARQNAFGVYKNGKSRFDGHAEIYTDNSEQGLYMVHTGTGIGQNIIMNNATSNSVAMRINQRGLATAQDIVMENVSSTANGLYLRHNGLGVGQQIVMNNTGSFARGLDILQRGRGDAIYIAITNATSTNNLIDAQHQGLGVGAAFLNTNSSNGFNAIDARTNGTGNGVFGATTTARNAGVRGTNSKENGVWNVITALNSSGVTIAGGVSGTTTNGIAGVEGWMLKNTLADLNGTAGGFFGSIYKDATAPNGFTTLHSTRVSYITSAGQARKVDGTGASGTIVKDLNEKPVLMTSVESPEVLFTDYGEGQLVNGVAIIKLDPIFTKNIIVDQDNSVKIFVQLEGDCKGVYVANKSATGFEVRELQGGNSNVRFSYEVVANRANRVDNSGNTMYFDSRSRFAEGPEEVIPVLETSERETREN